MSRPTSDWPGFRKTVLPVSPACPFRIAPGPSILTSPVLFFGKLNVSFTKGADFDAGGFMWIFLILAAFRQPIENRVEYRRVDGRCVIAQSERILRIKSDKRVTKPMKSFYGYKWIPGRP